MAAKISSKKPNFAKKRSHALNTNPKKQDINYQIIKTSDGKKKRISVREMRSYKKGKKCAA